jgi:transposase
VADATWLAELLEHGLLRGSFVPPRVIRELRDLTRYRKRLVQAHTSEGQRIAKILEDAGIKLDSVVSHLLGVSGRAMLRALIAGERDPEQLAQLARGRLRTKIPALAAALEGRFAEHHAIMIGLALDHFEYLERSVVRLDERVDDLMAAHSAARDRSRQARRGGHHRRDRGGHECVPHRRTPGVVGANVSGQQHHRR